MLPPSASLPVPGDDARLHAALNPEADYEIAGDERLVLLARGPGPAFDPCS